MIGTALDDFDRWEKTETDKINKQIDLIQENVKLWKQTTDTDSEEEN